MAVELITTCLGIFSDPIKQYIVTPLNTHINYAFTLHSYVDTLRNKVQDLKNKRDRLEKSVVEARQNGDDIFPNVTEWLSTVEKTIGEAEELTRGQEEAKNKCCPNLKTRCLLSKKADKKALAIDEQLKNEQGLHPISFRPRLQQIVELSVYSHEALTSRVRILNEIIDALKDPNLKVIGVHGMGGVGKSTLVKEVRGQALKEKLFETVIKVLVSQNPDFRKIQGEIAGFLNLQLNAKEILVRASELHGRLKKDKVLIILDDVWEKLDLTAVGIPFGDESEGCKILLTSRRKDVLSNEMRTQREFHLDLLREGDEWRLFEKIVNTGDDPEFLANNRDLAKEIVNKCGGLPLLIEKVATDLRNNKELYAWEDMLNQLKSMEEGTEIYERVRKVFESSYEKVPEGEAKSLFLLCSLFGNSNIRIQDLLIYCMGLGLFKRDSIEGSRSRVLTLIGRLKNESLLLDGDKAGFVKIHDVVRDIATAIASRVQHAFVGKGEIRRDCRRISLPYCDVHEFPQVLQYPEAEVFSVFANDLSVDLPALYFERVTKLKVLHFTGVSFVSGLPSSIGSLTGLQTLTLHRCKLINVAMVAELRQLKVLSFAGSTIAELPKEMEALTQLKLLDLTCCYHLRVPPNVLSNLRSLEELYMLNSFDGWDTEGNARLVELKNSSCLKTLEIRVKDDKLLPEDWFSNGIQHYKIVIGDHWHWSDVKETSRMLMLTLKRKTSNGLMHRIKEFMGGAEVLYLGEVNGLENLSCDSSMEKIISFERLRVLHIQNCDSLREVLPFSSVKCLPHLQEMEVRSCSNIEAIVAEGNGDEVMEFPQLTSLKLTSLPICRISRGKVAFPNLTSLEIYECKSLKYVFTTLMVKSLKQLKNLEISKCELMEEIILVAEFEGIAEVMEFPQLTSVRLSFLPHLTCICKTSRTVSFPSLTSLQIMSCTSLKYVFTTSMVKSLKQLKKLDILSCESMEEIILVTKFEGIEEEDNINMIIFPELDFLCLDELPTLKRFSSGYQTKFPKLRKLEITTFGEIKEYVFNDVVIPNVEVLQLDHHSLKAITQRDDKGFSVESLQKLKEVTLVDLEEESVPFFFDFVRRIYSVEKLTFNNGYLGEILSLDDERATGDQEQCYNVGLKLLHLIGVRKLKHIVKQDSQLNPIFQCNQTLKVGDCYDLISIAPSSSTGSFQNLTTLVVYGCLNMTSLVTASTAKSMLQLTELQISYCEMMEEIIVANDEGNCTEEHDDDVTFNKLKNLTLYALPTLNSFCSANYNFTFPFLEQVDIEGCNQMKIFCGGVVHTPKLQCEGNLNAIMAQQDGWVEIPKRW